MNTLGSLYMRVAALTHVGLRRQANEDCIAVGREIRNAPMDEPWLSVQSLDAACVCLVADGMGGHPAGDVASRVALETVLAGCADALPGDRELVELLRATNRFLFSEMSRCPQWHGMGTTLAGIVADARSVAAFNVGDSRIYRVEDGSARQLSIDDSEIVGGGFFFHRLPTRVLNQCLGGFPDESEIAPHVLRLPAVEGAEYLLCSDGLSDMLDNAAISACLHAEPARSVQRLFEAAMDEGGIDNISIILARIERGCAIST